MLYYYINSIYMFRQIKSNIAMRLALHDNAGAGVLLHNVRVYRGQFINTLSLHIQFKQPEQDCPVNCVKVLCSITGHAAMEQRCQE